MGWKPARGSGITFDKVFRREEKYRIQLCEAMVKPVSIKELSKIYYHWLIAMRDYSSECILRPMTIQQLWEEKWYITETSLNSLISHKSMCCKGLKKIMDELGI